MSTNLDLRLSFLWYFSTSIFFITIVVVEFYMYITTRTHFVNL